MRYQTTEQELPARMRRFLADIDAGRACFSDTLIKQRQHISSALRGLIDAAKLDGLSLQLSQQTAQAFTSWLEREGWAPASIACQHGYLRKYAYETGEGMDWALTSGRFDRRPLALVFRAAHWAPYSKRRLRPTGVQLGSLKFQGRSSSIRLAGWPAAIASSVTLR